MAISALQETLNYFYLSLNYVSEKEKVWHHTCFLLFTPLAPDHFVHETVYGCLATKVPWTLRFLYLIWSPSKH